MYTGKKYKLVILRKPCQLLKLAPPQVTTFVDSVAIRFPSVTMEFLSLAETSYWTQEVCCMALYSPSLNIIYSCVHYFIWQLSLVACLTKHRCEMDSVFVR